ncbi:MAG: hypothetical protein ABEL51_15665, partial [Salinibacter sp.]
RAFVDGNEQPMNEQVTVKFACGATNDDGDPVHDLQLTINHEGLIIDVLNDGEGHPPIVRSGWLLLSDLDEMAH